MIIETARRRRPWAVLGALGVFAIGLAMGAVSLGYDLDHWDAVLAPARAGDVYEEAIAEELLRSLTHLCLYGLAVTAVLLLMLLPFLYRGSAFAAGVTVVVAGAYLLAGAWSLTLLFRFDEAHPHTVGSVPDPGMPGWKVVCHYGWPGVVVAGALATIGCRLLPATRRIFRTGSPAPG